MGKAADLRNRVASYFRASTGPKTHELLRHATHLEFIETSSEIEALLKETELIKKYRPKFNILMRDDKSYSYVIVTRDAFPRMLVIHKTALGDKKWGRTIGPFTSGSALRTTLKLLRRIFPYCTCMTPHKRPCLNAQIGRCLAYCCTIHDIRNTQHKKYRKNIRNIFAVLSGKKKGLLSQLKKAMRLASRAESYERAAKLRDQIDGIENIFQHRQLIEVRLQSDKWIAIEPHIRTLLGAVKSISRVEGYDISNISGAHATGSMVVFIDGKPAKAEYRKFKIKTVHQANDVGMLKEVLRRRLAHPEWQYPDLMLIDGGKPQLNVVRAEMTSPHVRVLALAKCEEDLYTDPNARPIRLDSLPVEVMHFLQRVRDESHRFAKKYHHKLREISYRKNHAEKV